MSDDYWMPCGREAYVDGWELHFDERTLARMLEPRERDLEVQREFFGRVKDADGNVVAYEHVFGPVPPTWDDVDREYRARRAAERAASLLGQRLELYQGMLRTALRALRK